MSSRNIASLILAVFLLQIAMPALTVDATSGRSTPDFSVSVMTLSSGGSVEYSGETKLAPGDHIVRIVVTNSGQGDGDATLNLVHRASPSSAESVITSISLGNIPAATSSNPILINWTALSGDDQTLFARVASSADTNTNNNENSISFDVTMFHLGTVLGDNIPGPTGGFTDVRLNHSIHTFDATVRNDGVMDLSAVMELNFTDQSNPSNKVSFWSNTLILDPGSLLYPSVGGTLSASFDANPLLGTWTMVARVIFNGTVWTNTVISSVETITFSDYIIDVSTPGDRAIEPGATTTLTWIISNLGSEDNLTVQLGSDLGWHDNSQDGSVINLQAGASTSIAVLVTVPSSAVKPTLENIYLNLTSGSSTPYTARSVAHVMVGDQYQATVIAPVGPVTVTPAQTESLEFTIVNTGNVPAAFNLDAGLSSSADNWDVILTTPVTDVLSVGSNITVFVQVTPAPISSPLDTGERNAAGDSIYSWVSATPVEGGIPALNSTQLVVRAVIAVDPSPETNQIILTPQEIIEANGSGGIDEILSLSVQVRHNLGGAVTGGVDANISISSPSFTPLSPGSNNEAVRWTSIVTPNSVSGLEVGEIFQSWLAIDGPGDEMPLAGELILPVTATPQLTAGQQSSGVLASSVTRNISVIIPSIKDGEIITQGPLDADVGNLTDIPIKFANTGNDITSYRLIIEDDLPELWTATLDTSTTNNPSIISNLTPSMSDHPTPGNNHITNVTLSVTTDPQAPADTLQPINIRVEDRDTGEVLSMNTLLIRVEESINFELYPTNHTIDLSPYESPLTRVYINNTGNVATTFSVWLDDSNKGDVDFSLESPTNVIVAPGYSDSVRIRLNPDAEASADELHMATLYVESINGINKSASIVANISADTDLQIDVDNLHEVTPGQNETIAVEFTNNGNLIEFLNVTAVVEGGWDTTWEMDQMVLPINGSQENDLTISIPSLGGEYRLADGDTHNVTISLYSTNNGDFLVARTFTLQISPVFKVEFKNWPDEMEYYRGQDRTWKVEITNVGNKDVVVDLTYDIFKPSLQTNSLAWDLVSGYDNNISLPVQVPVTLEFKIELDDFNPDIHLLADFILTMDPKDPTVEGTATAKTVLKMSRLYSHKEYKLEVQTPDDDKQIEFIEWSHTPQGIGNSVSYMIELCGAERRINSTNYDTDEDYDWDFAIRINGTDQELNLDNNCDGVSHSVISLPEVEAWATNELEIVIDEPRSPNIVTNDGYDLTFRLYHPDEHNGFTEFSNATFSFYFDTDPKLEIENFGFEDSSLIEGKSQKISATVSNVGTAIAFNVKSELICDGIEIADASQQEVFIAPRNSKSYTWDVENENLDWWSQSREVSCELKVSGEYINGAELNSTSKKIDEKVESWSPGIGVSFVAFLALLITSIGLIRLVGQNDKFRLAAVYSGVLALGFAFHLMQLTNNNYAGIVVLLIAAVWVWIMTWKSTDEFQLIHEDYQRARKGISTLYSDHFDVLSNAKRQLAIILSMPILGMIGVILGFPPQMAGNSANAMSLVGYLAVVIVGVVFLIWNANRMYGSLYGRLTEVEVQASRIERDLGDPARLLTELASDGLDISSIISTPKPNVAADGESSTAEVANWDEDITLLTQDEDIDESITENETVESPSLEIELDDLFEDDEDGEVKEDG